MDSSTDPSIRIPVGLFGDVAVVLAYVVIIVGALTAAQPGPLIIAAFLFIFVWGAQYGHKLLLDFFGFAGPGLKVTLPTWSSLLITGAILGALLGWFVAPYRILRTLMALANPGSVSEHLGERHGRG